MTARARHVVAFCDHLEAGSCGGIERIARELGGRLATAGIEVTLVGGTVGPATTPIDCAGFRVRALPATDLGRWVGGELLATRGLRAAAERAADDAGVDAVLAFGLHFTSIVEALRFARRHGAPLVTNVQLAEPDHPSRAVRIAARGWERVVARRVVRGSARLLAASGAVAEHLGVLGADPAVVRVAPNGVDHGRFAVERPTHLGEPRLCSVGRLAPNKGTGVLLDALRILDREGLRPATTIAGDGALRRQLEHTAAAHGLDHVRFLGRTDDVPGVLAHAEVFVRPSYSEGLPLAVLEAMAARCAVVASDLAPHRELLPSGAGLLARTGCPRSLAACLATLLRDDDRRRSVAASGYEVSRSYTWERCAAATVAAIEEVAA